MSFLSFLIRRARVGGSIRTGAMGNQGEAPSSNDAGDEATVTTNDATSDPTTTEGKAVKTRKPYTITKKRERWSDEEHALFVESLKKYGRAWKRIEEYIGTKSAVQIRSHAQKFFAKLQKEQIVASGSEGSGSTRKRGADRSTSQSKRSKSSYATDINLEIPPARPKKKPAHPYPRKATSQQPSGGSGERDNSGGTGKSSGTAQKWPTEASQDFIASTSSSAAIAAVLSVACDKMQNNLHQELRQGYFGIPTGMQPQQGMFAQPGMFPMNAMMSPFVAMITVSGAPSPPPMTNPQQFLNYANFFSNYWPQFANAANANAVNVMFQQQQQQQQQQHKQRAGGETK